MISVEEACQIIASTVKDFGTELIPLDQAVGRVLREELFADRDFPPYNRVTMDGIAINSQAFRPHKIFPLAGIAAAGAPQLHLENMEHCLEVMTGSILPSGTDSVIRYEDLDIKEGQAKVVLDALNSGQNVHKQGEDRQKGSKIVPAGIQLSPAEIGVAATVGKTHLKVSRLPKAIIISTGDELVKVSDRPLPYQIRRSNVHRLLATLNLYDIPADTAHLLDDLEEVTKKLENIIKTYEVIILSGGVSKGKYDYLPHALEKLGVKKHFHKIKQRPGKPFWFGEAPNGAIIFALPGNPVSSFMCTQVYFKDWLNASIGLGKQKLALGVLENDIHFKPDLTYFAQVKISYTDDGRILAKAVEGHGSGDLANLVDADAFVRLPRGKNLFKKGEVYPLYFYR